MNQTDSIHIAARELRHGDPVRIERSAEACITCDTPLTADDPAVTTLGPRCRRHF